MNPNQRTYYDHEPAYRQIAAKGGRGWDDLQGDHDQGSYNALDAFLVSSLCPSSTSDARALDLGCGGGQAAMRVASRGFAVCAIDFSETAIQLAIQNAKETGDAIEFIVGDCLDLKELDDKTYDLVIDNHVLHCLVKRDDRRAFLSSAKRVLKSSGIFFSETMSAEGNIDMELLHVDPLTRVDRNGTRFWVTRDELVTEFQSAGFEILNQEQRSQPDLPPPGDTIVTIARRAFESDNS